MNASRRAGLRAGLAAFLLAWSFRAPAQDPRASVVAGVARDWLALADKGDAAATHAKAGARFRQAMSQAAWSQALGKERTGRGAVAQRTLVQTRFDPKAPGMPPGEFAVLLYRTSFAKHPDAGETVTLEREKDGAWRVVGYSIR